MSDIPDSASTDQLLQRIRDLRNEGGLPPRATTLPSLPLTGESSGILDLTVVLEQLVLDAGGVNVLQIMHLAAFLLDAAIDGIKKEITPYLLRQRGSEDPEAADVEIPVAQGVVAKATSNVAMLNASHDLLQQVLIPLSNQVLHLRARKMASLGHEGAILYRRLLVSDQLIDSLGIERSEFNAYFRKRYGAVFGKDA
jgi:hypothetical protein